MSISSSSSSSTSVASHPAEELGEQLASLAITLHQKLAEKDRQIAELQKQLKLSQQYSNGYSLSIALQEKDDQITQLCQELEDTHRNHHKEKLKLQDTIYCLEREMLDAHCRLKKIIKYSV